MFCPMGYYITFNTFVIIKLIRKHSCVYCGEEYSAMPDTSKYGQIN